MKRALLFFLLALFPSIAKAATYYVDCSTGNNSNDGSSGSPWLTLRYAGDHISGGDTVIIKDGTCTTTEASNDQHWGPAGSSGSYTTWKCENAGACTIDGPIRTTTGTPSYYSFEDLVVTNGGFWWEAATGTWTNFRLLNSNVSGGGNEFNADSDSSNWSCLFLQDGENAEVSGNTIHDCASVELDCLGGQACGAGIKLYTVSTSTFEHNLIYDNAVEGISQKQAGDGNIYRRNIIKNNIYNIYHCNQGVCTTSQIYENIFQCTSDDQIGVLLKLFNQNHDIYNNVFYNCGGSLVAYSTTTEADSNTGTEFYNNISYNASQASGDPRNLEFERWDVNEPTTQDYNVYYNTRLVENRYCNSGALGAGDCDQLSAEYFPLSGSNFTAWKAAHTGIDVHSVASNPQFVNPGAEDFHLQSGSPGEGTGSAGADIGAYPRRDSTVIGPDSGGGGSSSELTTPPIRLSIFSRERAL